jgi:hypothetical protein
MLASDIILDAQSFIFSTNECSSGKHYKYLMDLGRILPTTRAQARYFVANRCKFDALNIVDVERVEAIFSEFGKCGEYKYTSSRRWVRLVNNNDFCECLKMKYNI